MPTTNYLNPGSFAPEIGWKPVGPLAGMLHYEKEQDYNNLMQNQMTLQNLATRREGLDLYNKTQDQPIEDLKRKAKLETLMAEQPYLSQIATTGAKAKIAENEKKPLELDKLRDEITRGKTEDEVKDLARSITTSKGLLQQAMAMGPEQGSKWLQGQIERYNSLGYKNQIDPWMANPAVWEKMHKGLMDFDLSLQGELKKQSEKDKASLARTELESKTQLQIARERNATLRELEASKSKRVGTGKPTLASAIVKANSFERDTPEWTNAMQEVEAMAEMEATKLVARSPLYIKDIIEAKSPEEHQDIFNRHVGTVTKQIMDRLGKPSMSPVEDTEKPKGKLSSKEQAWFDAAKKANPSMSDSDIMREGKQRGYLQ